MFKKLVGLVHLYIFSKISFVKFLTCLLLPLSVTFSAHSASADPCLAFVSQDNRIVKEIALNVSEALTAAHICHTIDYFPEKRADYLFKQEKYDGFLMRDAVFGTKSIVPVVKLEPVLIQTSGVILSKDADVKTIEDLNGRSIGITRGWLWMENLVRRYPRVVRASNIVDLSNLLSEGRVDTILVINEILPFVNSEGYNYNNKIIDLKAHVFLKETSKEHAEAVSKSLKKHIENGNSFINVPRILNSFFGNS